MPRKKATTKKSTRKMKLESLSETHGKIEEGEKPTTLDQIWGDTGLWKYKTMDLIEYKKYLMEMNKTDLQAHAKKIGLIPIDDRINLNKRLVDEFKKHISAYKSSSQTKETPQDVSEEAKRILSEGR